MSGTALIGYTGFVGGTLHRARPFDAMVNSKTIGDLRGRSFDLVVCAGVPAVKWLANKEPEADRTSIATLTDTLATVQAREFVLISTIDVYLDPGVAADEDHVIDAASNHAYGRHRRELEEWVTTRFPTTRIVRLPALFGDGLKKNVIFDLLHGNLTDAINPASAFQWYPLRRLHDDIERIRSEDLRLVNLFTEPLVTADIVNAFFPGATLGPEKLPAPAYNLRTKYAEMFGGPPGYLLGRTTVLGELAGFIAQERNRR